MAAKRRKAADPLDEPIIRPFPLVVGLVAHGKSPAAQDAIWQEANAFVGKEKIRKLILLANRYGVDLGSPNGFFELCLHMAHQHVPGFKVVDAPPRGRGQPAKDYFELVEAVHARVDPADGRYGVLRACERLSREKGPWKRCNPRSLRAKYREWLRQVRDRAQQPDTLFERLRVVAEQADAKRTLSSH